MTITQIGKFQSELSAEQNFKVREIVKEIVNFGVNDRMIVLLMYLLSLNIEDNELMKQVSLFLRDVKDDVFLIDIADKQELENV